MSKYIDADKAIKNYARYGIKHFYDATDLEAILNECPAADVQEVKHGRWVEHLINNIYCEGGVAIRLTCPVCGECFTVTKEARPRERFCRWCGAKMDEVEDNG